MNQFEDLIPATLSKGQKKQLLRTLEGMSIEYDLVTYDFGTAMVVGKEVAVPMVKLKNFIGGTNE